MAFYDKNGKKVFFQKIDPEVFNHPAVRKFRMIKAIIATINIGVTAIVLLLLYGGVI